MSKRTADAELPDAPGSGGGAPDGSLFARYPIDPRFYDEMFEAGGAPRDHCHELWNVLDGMAPEDIAAIQEHAERSFLQEGITFAVYGEAGAQERIIPIDVLPRIVDADTWEFIERGLRQRLRALNLFLADIYGRGRILSDGVDPVDMVYGCPQYRIERRGLEVPQGIHVALCGIDLVRTHDGFMVLEDNLRVPSGVSYMLANRGAVKSSLNNLFRQYRVRGIEHYGSLLRQTLSELAPPGVSDPCIVLLTPGSTIRPFTSTCSSPGRWGWNWCRAWNTSWKRDAASARTTRTSCSPLAVHGEYPAATCPGTCIARVRPGSNGWPAQAIPGVSSFSRSWAGSASIQPTIRSPITASSPSPWAATMRTRARRAEPCWAAENRRLTSR